MTYSLIDPILVLAAAFYAIGGYRNGALIGALSFVGFFGGAAIGAQLATPVGKMIVEGAAQVPIAIVMVFLCATIGQVIATHFGHKLRPHVFTSSGSRQADHLIGSVFSVMAVLLVAWMVAVPLASAPSPTLASAVRRSAVIRAVDSVVPASIRDLYASMRRFIDRSGFPEVFGNLQPTRIVDVPPPDPKLLGSAAVQKARPSVLKVRAVAHQCGHGIEGSGFVYAPQHLMTNAHVVAGADEVGVQADGGTLPARVVLFDPERDIAVLYVPGLDVKTVPFAAGAAKTLQDAIVLGYPEDGPFDVRAARVRDESAVIGHDIYGEGTVQRDVYTIRARVRVGNSGGPLIDTHGAVLGVVFASAVDSSDTGFVLTAREVASDAQAGRRATQSVGTDRCTE